MLRSVAQRDAAQHRQLNSGSPRFEKPIDQAFVDFGNTYEERETCGVGMTSQVSYCLLFELGVLVVGDDKIQPGTYR